MYGAIAGRTSQPKNRPVGTRYAEDISMSGFGSDFAPSNVDATSIGVAASTGTTNGPPSEKPHHIAASSAQMNAGNASMMVTTSRQYAPTRHPLPAPGAVATPTARPADNAITARRRDHARCTQSPPRMVSSIKGSVVAIGVGTRVESR